MEVNIKLTSSTSTLPAYATESSAGMDLHANIVREMLLGPQCRAMIPTGIAIQLPPGYEAQVRSRSGLANNHGVVVLNSPGTIDADYRGEIFVILINHSHTPFVITPNMRCAQLVVGPYTRVTWNRQHDLADTARGVGGIGSTGI